MLSRFYEWGNRWSAAVANAAGHPSAQLLVIVFCLAWLAIGRTANALTLVLSIAAITLTQMVLNQQRVHDAALHAKIDELLRGVDGARDELAGIEEKSEEEILAMKQRLTASTPDRAGTDRAGQA
jgi:low affinity Fe/Cu permease